MLSCKYIVNKTFFLKKNSLLSCPYFIKIMSSLSKTLKIFAPTRNLTSFLLKMDLNIHKTTTFALKCDQKRIFEQIYDFFAKLIKKSQFLMKNSKKMQPPKMTFRSQLEPSIKSYECFMFLLNFRLEVTLDWWILERP